MDPIESLLSRMVVVPKLKKDNLAMRDVVGRGLLSCVGECEGEELVSHLFFECPLFSGLR